MSSPPYLGVSGADRPLVEPLGTVGAVHAPAYLLPLVVIVPGDLVPHGLHRIHEVSIGHGAPCLPRRNPGFLHRSSWSVPGKPRQHPAQPTGRASASACASRSTA